MSDNQQFSYYKDDEAWVKTGWAAKRRRARNNTYIELIRNVKGARTPRYDGRIIVVGHLMAGKTTLISRLLLQHFHMKEIESTNGIVTTLIGAMKQTDGDWTYTENPKDSKQVLKRMLSAKAADTELPNISVEQIQLAKEVVDQMQCSGMNVESNQMFESKETDYTDTETNASPAKPSSHHESVGQGETHSKSRSDEDSTCRLYFMDFAGQSVFNSTHQMFMTHRAVYLLVLDISRELDSEIEDDVIYCVGANRKMSVLDITEFLLSTIHVYSGEETESFPKVLLVGTHKDLVEEDIAIQRIEKVKERFYKTPLQKHVLGDFIVDCSIENDPQLDLLRKSLFEIVQNEPYWGEKTPASWLPLEKCIINCRLQGNRILTLDTVQQINQDECFVKIESDEEIITFLQFHNLLGNFAYFGGAAADTIVILDPQWLIDALKQIFTHERFYTIPEGLEAPWEKLTESAKLHKKLIEAVWSKNKDKTFITYKKQLLDIFEQTDIIASPLSYDRDGKAKIVDYYFVPSMLKPNKEGKTKVTALLKNCRSKSPSLCFVFANRFLQPAIFPRIQTECTSIYKIKEINNKPLMFYQVAVFQLNETLDLIIEQVEYVIKVTVLNENGIDINSEICENVRLTLEDSLMDIVQLYGGSTAPFQKAVQCEYAPNDINALVNWSELEKNDSTFLCKAILEEDWQRVSSFDVLGPWAECLEKYSKVRCVAKSDHITISSGLEFMHLARLARRLEPEKLILAARSRISESDWQHCRHDNKDHKAGEVYDVLVRWRKQENDLTLNAIHRASKVAKSEISIELLQETVADTDTSEYFKDFDENFLETRVSDEAIDMISQSSAKRYRFLALELGIDNDDIDCVIKSGMTHRAKALLIIWRSHSSAKYREIGTAIIEVDMNNLLLRSCQQLVKDGARPRERSRQYYSEGELFDNIDVYHSARFASRFYSFNTNHGGNPNVTGQHIGTPVANEGAKTEQIEEEFFTDNVFHSPIVTADRAVNVDTNDGQDPGHSGQQRGTPIDRPINVDTNEGQDPEHSGQQRGTPVDRPINVNTNDGQDPAHSGQQRGTPTDRPITVDTNDRQDPEHSGQQRGTPVDRPITVDTNDRQDPEHSGQQRGMPIDRPINDHSNDGQVPEHSGQQRDTPVDNKHAPKKRPRSGSRGRWKCVLT